MSDGDHVAEDLELEGLLERRFDRKGFVAASAFAGLLATGAGRFVPDAAAAVEGSGTLHYYNWADYVNPRTYTLFTRKTGIRVRKSFYTNNEALQAKLQAGARGYDLVVPTGYMVKILAEAKLLQRINWSQLPTVRRNIDPKFRRQPYDPRDRFSVAKDWGTTGFVYRTDKVKERPTSWREFFGLFRKYPRRFTLLDSNPEVIGSIAVMMGYSYSTDNRRELDRVRDFLLDLKPFVHSIDAVTYKQKIATGRAFGGMAWNGDGAYVESKAKARYVIAKEGGEYWIDCYCIPVGARNPDAAHQWIDFVYTPNINSLETQYTGYSSPLKRSMIAPRVPRALLRNPAVFPNPATLRKLEPNRVSPLGTQLRNRIWTEFKAK